MTDNSPATMLPGLDFPETMTLSALQTQIAALCVHYGWDRKADEQAFLLFVEEVGELAKAMRSITKLGEEQNNPDKPVLDADTKRHNLAGEFADVLSYLIELANRMGVDLETAYKDKWLENMQRQWN